MTDDRTYKTLIGNLATKMGWSSDELSRQAWVFLNEKNLMKDFSEFLLKTEEVKKFLESWWDETSLIVDWASRIYIITDPIDGSRTTLGFAFMKKRQEGVADWMDRPDLMPKEEETGTPAAYRSYKKAMREAAEYANATKSRCEVELTPQLIGLEGKRVEVEDTDGSKRRFWVGRSTGWMPVHLEIPQSNSSGGSPVCGAPFKSLTVIKDRP